MVGLENFEIDPTLEAVHRTVEARENSQPKRDYLGASVLGHACERFAWYGLNHPEKAEPISYKGLYAIADGHFTEKIIIDRLRLVDGIELWDRDENGNQIGFDEVRFKGHVDGIILGLLQAPKTPHIFEAKACNEKKFNELQKCKEKYGEKAALEAWDFQFYVQAQLYMGALELTRHYLICATPGGRDMISVRTEFDETFYKNMLRKVDRILNAKEPPARISEYPSHYLCKWCSMREFCWKDDAAA
jgi:hypothetical protein